MLSILSISFWTIKHWPPLTFSLVRASLRSCEVCIFKNDFMFILFVGGVCKKEKSFKPENTRFIVLGIGVADK